MRDRCGLYKARACVFVETEAKFRVQDHAPFREKCRQLGLGGPTVTDQVDTYHRHPVRDFRATDEALRVRRVGDHQVLTYKGPKQSGPVKARLEIECPVQGDVDQILAALGMAPAATVKKRREAWRGDGVEVALDSLPFGAFVEVEATSTDLVLDWATRLGLDLADQEPRSYLEIMQAL